MHDPAAGFVGTAPVTNGPTVKKGLSSGRRARCITVSAHGPTFVAVTDEADLFRAIRKAGIPMDAPCLLDIRLSDCIGFLGPWVIDAASGWDESIEESGGSNRRCLLLLRLTDAERVDGFRESVVSQARGVAAESGTAPRSRAGSRLVADDASADVLLFARDPTRTSVKAMFGDINGNDEEIMRGDGSDDGDDDRDARPLLPRRDDDGFTRARSRSFRFGPIARPNTHTASAAPSQPSVPSPSLSSIPSPRRIFPDSALRSLFEHPRPTATPLPPSSSSATAPTGTGAVPSHALPQFSSSSTHLPPRSSSASSTPSPPAHHHHHQQPQPPLAPQLSRILDARTLRHLRTLRRRPDLIFRHPAQAYAVLVRACQELDKAVQSALVVERSGGNKPAPTPSPPAPTAGGGVGDDDSIDAGALRPPSSSLFSSTNSKAAPVLASSSSLFGGGQPPPPPPPRPLGPELLTQTVRRRYFEVIAARYLTVLCDHYTAAIIFDSSSLPSSPTPTPHASSMPPSASVHPRKMWLPSRRDGRVVGPALTPPSGVEGAVAGGVGGQGARQPLLEACRATTSSHPCPSSKPSYT